MRFSILIPTFNRADLLSQAIESVLGQTYRDCEILVIEDGSTDATPNLVARCGSTVEYLRQTNQGKSAALNLGIEKSKGDVIVVLDDDDVFPPWALSRHAVALTRNPTADFSWGRFVRFRGRAMPSPPHLHDMEFVPVRDPRRLAVKLMENCFLPNPAWAVRREAQLRAGRYDKDMYFSQDYDMILRLARRNEGVFVDDVVFYQRKHGSVRGPNAEQEYVIDTVDKWIKYDALLFDRLDRDWDLADFRPFLDAFIFGRDEALALLQKGVILFQRKAYDGAKRALAHYRRHLDARSPSGIELRIATGLLGCRYHIADLVSRGQLGDEVIRWLRDGRWPMSMRMALASQLQWRIRHALASGDARGAGRLVRFSCKAFGMIATAAVLGSRYSARANKWRGST
jgi:glycosyltransferase involved in cell wall biosynthesis